MSAEIFTDPGILGLFAVMTISGGGLFCTNRGWLDGVAKWLKKKE